MLEFEEGDFAHLKIQECHQVWLKRCLEDVGKPIEWIGYVFVGLEEIRALNKRALNHDYATDIITFDLRETLGLPLNAEIYICIQQVQTNALEYGCTFDEELKRVMIHGILHLVGYNDKNASQKAQMRLAENKYIHL